MNAKKALSLLRQFVEDLPKNDKLGVNGDWGWTPAVEVDRQKLASESPTTEYSSREDDE